MTTQTRANDPIEAELDDYSLRARRRPAKKTAAELIGYTAAAGGLAFAGGDAVGGVVFNNNAITSTVTAAGTGTLPDIKVLFDIDGAGGADVSFRVGVGENIGFANRDYGFVRISSTLASAYLLASGATDGPAVALATSFTLSGNGSTAPGGNYWYNTQNTVFRAVDGVSNANIPFGSTGYIGLRFDGDTGTVGPQFAWLKVRAEYDTTTPGSHSVSFSILQAAYEDTGAPLHFTGAPTNNVPTPATPLLALLGMGAMGIQGYRRRRDAGLKRQADASAAA